MLALRSPTECAGDHAVALTSRRYAPIDGKDVLVHQTLMRN